MPGSNYINFAKFFLAAVILKLIFIDLSWFSYLAIIVSLYHFALLFFTINDIIPIRNLICSLMCLQMLFGPALAFNGLDSYQVEIYKMQLPEAEYFSYVFPAVICFNLGVFLFSKGRPGERPDIDKVNAITDFNPFLPYVLIIIGFISNILSIFFGKNFVFIFVLLEGFKFIGLYMMVLSKRKTKPIYLILVYGSIFSTSLIGGMFHDLITWIIFLLFIYAYIFKPSNLLKGLVLLPFIGLIIVIQQLKGDYREATWKRGEEASVETLTKSYESGKSQKSVFTLESFAKSNIRINQGYIITNIMTTVPSKVPFEQGAELFKILEAAFFPRFLAPNKLNAGDRDIFMKYSGIFLSAGTSMALSSVGDGYINYGIIGGWIFMFCLGLFFSLILRLLKYYSYIFPAILIFTPLIFYYPIRPDCELQTILGHLVKSLFLVFVVFNVWKGVFKYRSVLKK